MTGRRHGDGLRVWDLVDWNHPAHDIRRAWHRYAGSRCCDGRGVSVSTLLARHEVDRIKATT